MDTARTTRTVRDARTTRTVRDARTTRTVRVGRPRRRLGSAVAALSCALLLGACSSEGDRATPTSNSPSTATLPTPTSSTLPPAEVGPAVRAYLAGKGRSLVEFQRRTDEIMDQPMPIARCAHYATKVLPKIATTPDSLRTLAQGIPDPRTAFLMDQDVGYKNMFLLICNGRRVVPQQGVDYLRTTHAELVARLEGFGITI